MVTTQKSDAPFSERFSLPARVSENLGDVSWETVTQLSTEFTVSSEEKQGKVRKIIKELELSRLLLLERVREGQTNGRVDPKLLVDAVRLIERCEEVAKKYEVDLREFSKFAFLISEKLKKEKLAHYPGGMIGMGHIGPIQDELSSFKSKSERAGRKKGRKK